MEVNPASVVWSPDLEAVSLSVAGLEVKLGSLVTLLLLTLISGLTPLFLFRRQAPPDILGGRRRALSLISCFTGGVFLATCLLDLLPNYLSGINDALIRLNITLQFPLQEFILAMGFFLVLVLEQIVLSYQEPAGWTEETHSLLGTDSRIPHPEQPHVHVDVNAHSAVRAVVLVLSLSLHSVLEGLAVGLLQESGKVLETCLALLIHKCIVSFSLTLKLAQGRLRPRAILSCLLLFAFMTPLGIGLGIVSTENADPLHQLTRSVLEGIATGTFLYITFLEILPHELTASDQRIVKVIVILCGFSVVTAILFVKI
ncbi:zinc transporter ZIP1 isoform X1 [Hyla sarda]|uniref:zinc transporter ZIP1 isoform X1 n=1 Tax=Hyla sarda TaxID=327740 RepID=UPI0024C33693|nr:zinc transporter ZIP1 isoform X1 [Hyla sarda]XP_056401484.1 zinc transporter ZIP1 isoform X1 [Hyla sarda]